MVSSDASAGLLHTVSGCDVPNGESAETLSCLWLGSVLCGRSLKSTIEVNPNDTWVPLRLQCTPDSFLMCGLRATMTLLISPCSTTYVRGWMVWYLFRYWRSKSPQFSFILSVRVLSFQIFLFTFFGLASSMLSGFLYIYIPFSLTFHY